MTTPKRALSTRHASLPIALIVLLLAAPLAPASAQAGSRIALSEAQVACNSAQLGALLSRTRVTSPDGTVPPLPQSLLVSYSNRFGFYEGLVVGLPRFRPSVEPPVFPPQIPGPEHQLGFHLDPSVRELLLNPERTPLEQVSLTREISTSGHLDQRRPRAPTGVGRGLRTAVAPTAVRPQASPGAPLATASVQAANRITLSEARLVGRYLFDQPADALPPAGGRGCRLIELV